MSSRELLQSTRIPMEEQLAMACQFLDLPEDGWQEVDGRVACSSNTWTHDQWIIQRRPRMRYRRMRSLYQASLQLDGALPGFRYHGPMLRLQAGAMVPADQSYLQTDSFWIAQPKLQGEVMFDLDASPQDLLRNLQGAMPKITEDLEYFSKQQLNMFELYRALPTHGIVQQNSSLDVLLGMVEIDPRLRRIADQIHWQEPSSRKVISHGDPTLKNIIWTGSSAELIDWESVWLLPRHRDFTHQVAFLCKYLPQAYWQQAIEIVWQHAQTQLPDWHRGDWQQACVWQLLREAIFFPPHDPESHADYLHGLQQMVDDLTL